MSRREARRWKAPGPLAVALGVLIVLAVAGGAWAALAALARPPHLHERLTGISEAARRIASTPREIGDPTRYAAHALCETPLLEAADALQGQLSHMLAASGLTISGVTVTPPEPGGDAARPTPITFRLNATGSYESVIGLLRALGENEPEVFADTVDLRSQTSSVSLKFTGRVLCRPPV